MGKHLVLVGGGHAHLTILKQLRQFSSHGYRVTLVNPSPFYDYPGLGPELLSGKSRLAEARLNIARMISIRGGRFIEATVTGIDPERRELQLDSGDLITYDIISFNSDSAVKLSMPKTAVGKTIFPVKPVAHLFHARQKIITASRNDNKRLRLLVIGGGPAGCETTGHLQELIHHEKIAADIILIAGPKLLARFPDRLRDQVRALLADKELKLFEGLRVKKLQTDRVEVTDGRIFAFDFAFVASTVAPIGPFHDSPLSGNNNGELTVNQFLQAVAYPEIFGSGDSVDFQAHPLNKAQVYAASQSPILRHNLMAALEQKPLQKFRPQKEQLQIFNLGLGRAVATGYHCNWSGFLARWLKFLRDKNFMRKFQETG